MIRTLCIAAAMAVAAGESQAATLQFELTCEFSGSGFNPTGSSPWGTATLVDVVPGQVQSPLPPAAWAGVSGLAIVGGVVHMRRRRTAKV